MSGSKGSRGVGTYMGLAGAAAGVAVAGTVAGVLTRRGGDGGHASSLGSLSRQTSGDARAVVTSDGLALHAEVDEAGTQAAGSDVTVVLVHGYALSLEAWRYQRLAATHRTVLYDHRSHGRSDRSPAADCTFEMLGDDLGAVIATLAPTGRIVLVGHSMGGMTILSLAHRHPDLFAERVAATCLISTCATGLGTLSLGLPPMLGRTFTGVSPAVLAGLARIPRVAERGRRAGASYAAALVRRLAFGGPVSPEVFDLANRLLASTPIDVIAAFYPRFARFDRTDVLVSESWPSTTIVCGEKDLVTPVQMSRELCELAAGSRLVEVAGAGHLIPLERPDEVSAEIGRLVTSVEARS